MKHTPPGPDHGTPELRRKHQTMQVPTEAAGIMASQVLEECLLDALKIAGQLGHGEQADRRHAIGIWLRGLFDKAGLRGKTGMSFEPPSDGRPEMSDAQAWNHRCWVETMRDVGRYAFVLRAVCCLDEMPHGYRLLDVSNGLDALADLRGL